MKDRLPSIGFSPYETGRKPDVDGSVGIWLEKTISLGKTQLYLIYSPSGAFENACALFKFNNRLEVEYDVKPKQFILRAENPHTEFGAIEYDSLGLPKVIHPAPLYKTEEAFWKEAPTDEDREIMDNEAVKYAVAMNNLKRQYGDNLTDIPLEAIPDLSQVCPTYARYLDDLRKLQAMEFLEPIKFDLRGSRWVALQERYKDTHSLKEFLAEIKRVTSGEIKWKDSWASKTWGEEEIASGSWNEQFLCDEQMFTIGQSEDETQLMIRQESVSGRKRKIVIAPGKINYKALIADVTDPVEWDKVLATHKTAFYAEL